MVAQLALIAGGSSIGNLILTLTESITLTHRIYNNSVIYADSMRYRIYHRTMKAIIATFAGLYLELMALHKAHLYTVNW